MANDENSDLEEFGLARPVTLRPGYVTVEDVTSGVGVAATHTLRRDRISGHNIEISTVKFTNDLSHYSGSSTAQWYETMVFGGAHNDYQIRYATQEEAVVGHHRVVAMVVKTLQT